MDSTTRPSERPPLKRPSFALAACVGVVVALSIGGVVIEQGSLASARATLETPRANPWSVRGVLRIGSQERPDPISQPFGEQYVDDDLSLLYAGYLVAWNDRDEFMPDLAAEVPSKANGDISRDGRTIVYHLRKGVVWQDGAPFTADDVLFSWHVVMNPRNHIGTKIGFSEIQRLDAPDRNTVVVHLKRPFAPFVGTFFAFSAEPVPVMAKHYLWRYKSLDQIPRDALPLGTGPFRVTYSHDADIRFEANDRYWRGKPGLSEISFHWLPDDRALVGALRQHRIDLYLEGAQALDPDLQGNRGFTVYLYPFTRFVDIGINLTRPGLRDAEVRHALAYATDRDRLIDEVTHGVNLPAVSDQPPWGWAYTDRERRYPYNPRLAARLLDEAGWQLGADGIRRKGNLALRLVMVGESGSLTDEKAEAEIQHEWRAVGVDLKIRNYSSNLLYADRQEGGIQQNGRFDVTLEHWGYGVDPDNSTTFMCDAAPPWGWNIYGYCNRTLDAEEKNAVEHYNRATRKRAYARIQAILAEDLPIIPMWFMQREDVVNVDLQNYKPAHAFSSFWNAWQWSI